MWPYPARLSHVINYIQPGFNPCAAKGCHPTKPKILCVVGVKKSAVLYKKELQSISCQQGIEVLPLQNEGTGQFPASVQCSLLHQKEKTNGRVKGRVMTQKTGG